MKKLFGILLMIASQSSAFAGVYSDAIYDAMTVDAKMSRNAVSVFCFTKSVGGLTCTRMMVAAIGTTKCSLQVEDRNDMAIYEALNVEAIADVRGRPVPGGGPIAYKRAGNLFCTLSSTVTANGVLKNAHCVLK